jgi:hypothetical protein
MPLLLAAAAVAALLVLAWAGVELNHVIHAYPGQFWMGAVAVLVIVFGLAAARFRVANTRVPLRPPAPALPPLPKAIAAVPELTAVASPHDEEAAACEGPACGHKVSDAPWTARVHGEEGEHAFCSRRCAEAWHDLRRPRVTR